MEIFYSIAKSRFSITLISAAYLVCLIYLIAMTLIQWKYHEIRINHFQKQPFLADLMGPLEIKHHDGRWGWPKNNSILRLISFMFLTISIIISWVFMGIKKFGSVWKFNLFIMFICVFTCFRYEKYILFLLPMIRNLFSYKYLVLSQWIGIK